jgi:hypothetical protein
MVATSVPAVMVWAKMTNLQLEEQILATTVRSTGGRSNFMFYAFHGYAFSQPVLAVAIWLGLIMLGQFKAGTKPKEMPKVAPVTARNVPCPCGSGLKYKRCCGQG